MCVLSALYIYILLVIKDSLYEHKINIFILIQNILLLFIYDPKNNLHSVMTQIKLSEIRTLDYKNKYQF